MIKWQLCLPLAPCPFCEQVTRPKLPRLTRRFGRLAACSSRVPRINAASRPRLNSGQPIEGWTLSGLFVASWILDQSEQRPQRIRGVTRGSTSEADGIERPKNEVAQQARIRFTGQNACTLCIPD
jgi:hypothetical protein